MFGPGPGGFDGGLGFSLFFTIIPIVVVGGVILVIGTAIYRGIKNMNSPIIQVNSKVIGKRTDISHHTAGENHMHHTSTTYYITFETEHGERIELSVSGRIYGTLIEEDTGILIYQGTWFKDFRRNQGL